MGNKVEEICVQRIEQLAKKVIAVPKNKLVDKPSE